MGEDRYNALVDKIADYNPEAMLADGFDAALIGVVFRATKEPVALYDYEKCIEVLMDREGVDYAEAVEWLEFNTLGSWVGEHTPAFAIVLTD